MLSRGGECPYYAKIMVSTVGAPVEAGRVPTLAGTATTAAEWATVAAGIRDEATDNCVTTATFAIARRAAAVR